MSQLVVLTYDEGIESIARVQIGDAEILAAGSRLSVFFRFTGIDETESDAEARDLLNHILQEKGITALDKRDRYGLSGKVDGQDIFIERKRNKRKDPGAVADVGQLFFIPDPFQDLGPFIFDLIKHNKPLSDQNMIRVIQSDHSKFSPKRQDFKAK